MKNENESLGKEISERLTYRRKNVFEESSPEKIADIFFFSEEYKTFLDDAKTEREAVTETVKLAKAQGFSEYRFGSPLKAGDLRYLNVRNKAVVFFRIGEEDLEENGIRILAAHIDSPRLDLKQVPMYEDGGMAFLKTHYYGGIKKYQWTAIPLSLHGVMVRKDGETVEISIGENAEDPIFYINDLLPHLSQKQNTETLANAVPAESLNILIGGLPYNDKEVEKRVKLSVLSILNDRYGVTEEDFISAELSLVPAFPARDVGFDRSMIAAYGHDDRVCAYPAFRALTDVKNSRHTAMVVLADKEEIGSVGNTGMQSDVLVDLIDEISAAFGKNRVLVRAASKCLSADVTAAFDPNFAEVYEKQNAAMVSCGTCMSKFTGARGKSGSSDASAEYVGFVRRLFDENGVIWQTAELGKVDLGGGGTVAAYIANHNIETVDLGVPVISMHAPYETISKADLYSTYEAFLAFLK